MSVPSSPHQDALTACHEKSFSFSDCKSFSDEASQKSKNNESSRKSDTIEPTIGMILPNKLSFDKDLRSRIQSIKEIGDRDKLVSNYASSIQIAHLPRVRKDCWWNDDIRVYAPDSCERVTFEKLNHSYIYTYPFTIGFGNPVIDPVILDLCAKYKVCLAQAGPSIWRAVACLRYLANKAGLGFTLDHLIHLYSPRIFRGGVIHLVNRGERAILSSLDEDNDRGWMERFVVVTTKDIIPESYMPFPETWNCTPIIWKPSTDINISDWVQAILNISKKNQRTWKIISKDMKWKAKNHGLPKGSSNFQIIEIFVDSEQAKMQEHISFDHKRPQEQKPIADDLQLQNKKHKKENILNEEKHVPDWVLYPVQCNIKTIVLENDDKEEGESTMRCERNSSLGASDFVRIDQMFEEYRLLELVYSASKPSIESSTLEIMTSSSTNVAASGAIEFDNVVTSNALREMMEENKKMQAEIDDLKQQQLLSTKTIKQLKKRIADLEADLASTKHKI